MCHSLWRTQFVNYLTISAVPNPWRVPYHHRLPSPKMGNETSNSHYMISTFDYLSPSKMILKLWVNQLRIIPALIPGIPESCRIYSIQSDIISNDTSKQFISVQEDDPELRALIRFFGKKRLIHRWQPRVIFLSRHTEDPETK